MENAFLQPEKNEEEKNSQIKIFFETTTATTPFGFKSQAWLNSHHCVY